jgi:hypothetical protein
VVATRGFDEDPQIMPDPRVHRDSRDVESENVDARSATADAIRAGGLGGRVELDDQIEPLQRRDGALTVEAPQIEHPERARLEIVPQQLGAAGDEKIGSGSKNFDHVVGDETMTAANELQCKLALADAAVAGQQDAEGFDFEEGAGESARPAPVKGDGVVQLRIRPRPSGRRVVRDQLVQRLVVGRLAQLRAELLVGEHLRDRREVLEVLLGRLLRHEQAEDQIHR